MSQLPALPSVLDRYQGNDGSGAGSLQFTPRGDRSASRLDMLEDRLHAQERTSSQLVERAYRIREDVLSSMSLSHGTWQEEKAQRTLLQEHIRTITDVVRKLNRDIMMIESDLKMRQGLLSGATDAVKHLEVNQAATLTDVRGRVARCDVSIAKLSTDIKGVADNMKIAGMMQQDTQNKLMDRMNKIDNKIGDMQLKVERATNEASIRIQHVEGDSSQQLSVLDSKTRALVEETRQSVAGYRVLADGEREKLEMRLISRMDRLHAGSEARVDRLEKRLDEGMTSLTRRVTKLEENIAEEVARSKDADNEIQTHLQKSHEATTQKHNDELRRLKREYREGFSTVHETVSHMKEVIDAKIKLMEEQLRKEIGHIRKTLVLI